MWISLELAMGKDAFGKREVAGREKWQEERRVVFSGLFTLHKGGLLCPDREDESTQGL